MEELFCTCEDPMEMIDGNCARCLHPVKDIIIETDCEHLHVTVHWLLYARETRYEPAEYIGKAECDDCGEWMEPEDVPTEAERKDVNE
jgi:hypothetical protein